MATSAPSNSIAFRVVENITFSKDFNQFLLQFSDLYQKLATASNSKDIGLYESVEILNGQQYFTAAPRIKSQVYRKCFLVTAIAPGATLNIAHGITYNELTRIYGTYHTAVRNGPLPRVSATLVTDQVSLDVVGPNIVIINGATAQAILSGKVTLEYIKN